jgi:outer membrane protein assembly factor BamB
MPASSPSSDDASPSLADPARDVAAPPRRPAARGALTRRAALLPLLGLGACSVLDTVFSDDSDKKVLPGRREAVLGTAATEMAQADSGRLPEIILPPVTRNADWAQAGGVATHVMGNLAGGFKPGWTAKIGVGASYRAKLTAQPVVLGGRVFAMDTDAVVSAFDLKTGERLWRRETRAKDTHSTNLAGGIAAEDGLLYVVTGRAEALALDATDGHVRWRATLAAPARSLPTLGGGRLYAGLIDGRLVALDLRGGRQLWSYQAGESGMIVLGQPAPAYADGIVVAGFGSGDLAAVHADTGTLVWTDNLGSAGGRSTATDLSSIRGAPVIDGGTVYAVGLGGLIVTIDLRSGRRIWERPIGGGQTPWIAGDWIYLVDNDQQLLAMTKAEGRVRWVADLPHYVNEKKHTGPLFWSGPALVNYRLVLTGDRGQVLYANPVSGVVTGGLDLAAAGAVPPVAAAGTLLILTDDGVLTALR